MEGKGLRVNIDKNKGMQLLFVKKRSVSKVDLCGVCAEWAGCYYIQCMKCQRKVHGRCSDMARQVSLLSCWDVFVYRICPGHNCLVEEKLGCKEGEGALEEVEKFCYLDDMISCYAGASEVVSARIGTA